jgi:DNA mismatch repair protein MutL
MTPPAPTDPFRDGPRTSFAETLPPLPSAQSGPSAKPGPAVPASRPTVAEAPTPRLANAPTRHFEPPAMARHEHLEPERVDPEALRARRSEEPETLPAGVRYLGQFDDTYLIVDFGRELVLVDQHAAHERVLFAAMEASGSKGHSRPLGIPVEVSLHPSEQSRLQSLYTELRALGFQLESPRPGLAAITGAPPGLTVGEAKEYLAAALSGQSKTLQDLWVLLSCKTAIKAGARLTDDEAVALLAQWAKAPERDYCPHGRPVSVRFGPREMEKMFKRKK